MNAWRAGSDKRSVGSEMEELRKVRFKQCLSVLQEKTGQYIFEVTEYVCNCRC